MLKKIQKLLTSKAAPKSAADIAGALDEIDIDALRSAADEAAKRRAALLLTGSDAEILDAERDADAARLAVDRAEALRSELERRKAEAEEVEAKAAAQAERAAAQAKVDRAVATLETEYPALAARIVEIIALAVEADAATDAWTRRYFDGDTAGLPLVDSVMERLGLHNRWMIQHLTVGNATRLLPVGEFTGHGVDWQETAHYHAVNGWPMANQHALAAA